MSKDRPQCGLMLEDGEGRILLQLRDDKSTIPFPNRWGTFGGQIEIGESALTAITREIWEELSYVLINPEIYGIVPYDGYDIYCFRKVDPNISLKDLRVREGQRGQFHSHRELKQLEYAFNCGELVQDYVKQFHRVTL